MPDGYAGRFDFSEALSGAPAQDKPENQKPKSEPMAQQFTDKNQTVQQQPVKDTDTSGRIKPVSSKKGQARQKDDGKTSYINIPKALVAAVRSMVQADNNHDAVSAYLYITTGRTITVPDKIKEIAAGYEDDAGVSDVQREVIALQQQLQSMTERLTDAVQMASDSQMALMWLVGEKLGFSVDMTSMPEKMDFLYPEYEALLRRIKQQNMERTTQIKLREGREVYKARFGKETL